MSRGFVLKTDRRSCGIWRMRWEMLSSEMKSAGTTLIEEESVKPRQNKWETHWGSSKALEGLSVYSTWDTNATDSTKHLNGKKSDQT